MSSTTPNLNLFKYDTATDGKEVFSIETALNDNWDLIDTAVNGKVSTNGSSNITITKSGPAIYLQNTEAIKGTTPTSNTSEGIYFIDSQGTATANRIGALMNAYQTNGTIYTNMYAFQPTEGSTSNSHIGIGYDGDGVFTYAPACARNNSIVTTTGISKNSNGYLKLGNGIILQWGDVSEYPADVTFPTAFSNAKCSIQITKDLNTAVGNYQLMTATKITKTGFYMSQGGTNYKSGARWFAIGY